MSATYYERRTWAEQRARLGSGASAPNEWEANIDRFAGLLAALFETAVLERAGDPTRFGWQLQVVVSQIIELGVEFTGCDDSWYWTVKAGVRWLCEARGLGLDEGQVAALLAIVHGRFTSWSCDPADADKATDEVTAFILGRARRSISVAANEVLRAHLEVTTSMAWNAPPPALAELFDRVDALGHTVEAGAMERYVEQFDRPAQLAAGVDTAEIETRERCFLDALARVRELATDYELLSWNLLCEVQALVLGRPVEFRTVPAFAQGGRERYAWWPELPAQFAAKLERDDHGVSTIAQAARLYLDIIYVHPFEDGNARAARLWLEFVLRRHGCRVPELGGLIKWPKRPASVERYQKFQELIARAILATTS